MAYVSFVIREIAVSHDLPEKRLHASLVLRASTHILTARYRFVIIIGGDKRRPFVETHRSFKTRPFSKWTTFRSTAWKHTDSSRLDRYFRYIYIHSRNLSQFRIDVCARFSTSRDLFSSAILHTWLLRIFMDKDFFPTRFLISCLLHIVDRDFSIRLWFFFFNRNLLQTYHGIMKIILWKWRK